MPTKQEVATTIKRQLDTGVLMSCGARDFMIDGNGLTFKVGSGNKRRMVIHLNGKDLYDVTRYTMKGGKIDTTQRADVPVENLNMVVRELGDV